MAPRTMKVKVPVSTLIELAEKQRAQIVRRHAKQVESADAANEKWQERALEALEKEMQRIASGKLPDMSAYYGGAKGTSKITVIVKCPVPNDPGAKPPTHKVDRDLALLRACSDTELLIGTDDNFAQYL